MKVLVIPSWYPPKGGYFFQELSEATVSKEIEIDVLANIEIPSKEFKLRNLFIKNILHQENNLNVYRSYMQRFPKINYLNNIRLIKETFRLYEKYIHDVSPPDIIHAHSVFFAGATAALINKKYKIPYIITEHRGRFALEDNKNPFANYLMPYIKDGFKNAEKIITVSPALDQKIIDIEYSSSQKLISIPNTIDSQFFTYKKKQKPDMAFSFFCLADLEYYKGIDILLDAFKIVTDKVRLNISLRIGGKGELYNNLNSKCNKLSLNNYVTFLGELNRQQVKEEMQNTDCFVLASRFEAFGVVLIEALACGTPVIGTDSGGPKYIINKENGILVDKENPKKLAGAMLKMIKDYKYYNHKHISKLASVKYDKSVIANSYRTLYKEVLKSVKTGDGSTNESNSKNL